ncbi:hypothetical protein HU200_058969 [Digitaria exilis]|uniref:Leucine-rich repeat-containing N-terminal plant-type domain-containing protein n=1 Tax=Digitaria exilis TaxID=1010633 RepID=A0A835A8D6_9POAL|nr:hypothetical protein HU200_058969 [Digitaria exilis]
MARQQLQLVCKTASQTSRQQQSAARRNSRRRGVKKPTSSGLRSETRRDHIMGRKLKHFPISLLLLLLSCYLAAAAAAASRIQSPSDAGAIADLARSLTRPPSTWTAAGGGDVCSFKGITCSDVGRVTAIDLAGEGLAGTLPSSLSNLTNLLSLQLHGNALSGAISSLTHLSLEGNSFTSLPVDFPRGTPALRSLTMDNLPLPPWPFPAAIFECPYLHTFSASNTSLTGAFPVAGIVSNLKSIATLRLAHNNLTGVMPEALGQIVSLGEISLSYNHFQGPVPVFHISVAVDDMVAGNGFCLDKPGQPCDAQVSALLKVAEGFGYPVNLSRSWTGNDPCNGWVGVECDISEVAILGLTSYNLSGIISPAIADLTGLTTLNLANNRLTGEIPDGLAGLPKLTLVDVRNNRLTGKLP